MRFWQISLGTLLIFSFLSTDLWAAKIQKVKGKRILVSMNPGEYSVGDILKIQGSGGKSTGLVKILKVKGKFAHGILKGKAKKGQTVVLRGSPKSKKGSVASKSSGTSESSGSGSNFWGVMVGLNSTSAKVLTTSNTEVDLKGMSYSVLAFMDFALMPQLNVRAMTGLEQFKVTGDPVCAGAECNANITFLALDAWARYLFTTSDYRPWVGAGFYMLFPMAKDSTALDDGSITNTSVFAFGGGLDIILSETSMIPIQVEYDLYPSSDTVKASAMAGRIGYGMSF